MIILLTLSPAGPMADENQAAYDAISAAYRVSRPGDCGRRG
jgi:hypothetical protein